jgi:hypothetical protein
MGARLNLHEGKLDERSNFTRLWMETCNFLCNLIMDISLEQKEYVVTEPCTRMNIHVMHLSVGPNLPLHHSLKRN